MKQLIKIIGVVLSFVVVTGCSTMSGHMAFSQKTDYKPENGKAMLVFMRPSALGAAVQATVFDVSEEDEKFIGVSSYQTKIPYQVEPGEHKFMVIGESADFMEATVEKGKTYYVVVAPRMGFWKARFSFRPVRKQGDGEFVVSSEDFAEWDRDTKWVEKNPTADKWYQDNESDIEAKRDKYWPAWKGKDREEQLRQTLNAEDGV